MREAPCTTATLPFDLYETADEVGLWVAIPGADPSQMEISVTQGALTLKGYRSCYSGDEEKQYTWHARNLSEGNFQFTVTLPTAVNSNAAEASYDRGVLMIRLPKAEAVKPKRIEIKGGQAQEALTAGTRYALPAARAECPLSGIARARRT